MFAISWVTFAGMTHASIENRPFDDWMKSYSFLLPVVEPWALPPLSVMPQPPNHSTSGERLRSSAGATPEVSAAIRMLGSELPDLNSQSAIWLFS